MATFDLTSATNLFKITYGKLSDNVYNSANVLLARIKKDHGFTGKRKDIAVPQSFQGGVGSGSLPTANHAIYGDAQISAKKVYSVVEIEREAIKASMNDEGAFVRGTKEVVQKGVESYMRNASRILFSGSLGAGTAGAANGRLISFADTDVTGTAAAPIITLANTAITLANLEEQDYVEVEDAEDASTTWEIVSVAPGAATTVITLARITGAFDMTAISVGAHGLYMQKSEGNDPAGLKGILDATSGTLYGITVARRWQAFQKAAGGAGISTDLMNEVMLGVQFRSGKVPNIILTSFTQYRKLLNLLEDQKQYIVEPRSQDLKGKISFRGLEFMSAAGSIGVFPERFCDDDRMYFLNDNAITSFHRPGFGWFEDDGTVFLRKASADDYEARYGGYYENYILPSFHGVLTGLAV